MTAPALIACSHGTRFAEGREAVTAIIARLAGHLPGTRVIPAVVDVEDHEIAGVVEQAVADGPAVVVPLLLSTGFHTGVDIARAVAPHPEVVAAEAMGPHPALVRTLLRRLRELPGGDAGQRPGDHVVLAAAGSSDPAAARACEEMRALLAAELPVPVTLGYGAGTSPRLPEAVAAARAAGAERVIAASYVLAPGHFANLVVRSGADLVSAPLGVDDDVVDVILERYREAAARLPVPVA
ncbi:sirohydrochlorin chelatase [Brachybacterium sp. DNPG3]